MSTLNQLNAIDETLFTELTAEQSEIVEGGMFLKIYSIESVVSRADVAGADDAYIKFQGNKVWGDKTMSTGDVRSVNVLRYFDKTFETVSLFDEDWGRDDHLGSFTVSRPTNGLAVASVSGSGSKYNVYYEVYA